MNKYIKILLLTILFFSLNLSITYGKRSSTKSVVYRTSAELQTAIDNAVAGSTIDLRPTIDAGVNYGNSILNITKNITLKGYPNKNQDISKAISLGYIDILANVTLHLDNMSFNLKGTLGVSDWNRSMGVRNNSKLCYTGEVYLDLSNHIKPLDRGVVFNLYSMNSRSNLYSNTFGISKPYRDSHTAREINIGRAGFRTKIIARSYSIQGTADITRIKNAEFTATNQLGAFIRVIASNKVEISSDVKINLNINNTSSKSIFIVETQEASSSVSTNLTLNNPEININILRYKNTPTILFEIQDGITDNSVNINGGTYVVKNDLNTPLYFMKTVVTNASDKSKPTIKFGDEPFKLITNNMNNSIQGNNYIRIPTNPRFAPHLYVLPYEVTLNKNDRIFFRNETNTINRYLIKLNTNMKVNKIYTNVLTRDLNDSLTIGYLSNGDEVYSSDTLDSPNIFYHTITSNAVDLSSLFKAVSGEFYFNPVKPIASATYTLIGNGGTINSNNTYKSSEKKISGQTPTGSVIDSLIIERTGYTNTNIDVIKNTVLKKGENIFTLDWTANVYNINYEVDGTTTTENVTYDSNFNLNTPPTKVGYTFDKWYTDSTFITEYVKPTAWNETSNITLYGRYIPNKYKVIYHERDGRTFEQEVEYDSPFTQLPFSTIPGYTEEKIYTNTSFSTEFNTPITWNIPGNVDLLSKVYTK